MDNENLYNFNNQDYECTIRLYNGINDVYLSNTVWEDLYIEEDLLDWNTTGSIIIKTPYDSLERESVESLLATKQPKEKTIYKFRNDCRDTLFISIKPKQSDSKGLASLPLTMKDQDWRLEIEAVVYDQEDLPHSNVTEKRKKLYFWEKTYQLMLEKDSDFSTANVGDNQSNQDIDQIDNSERTLKTGSAIAELLKNDDDFKKHAKNTSTELWEHGSDDNKIFFSSPVGSKFLDNLNYLLHYTTASKDHDYQPCILQLERTEKPKTPKQFTLLPIAKYFEKAGKDTKTPKEYQKEHFFLQEISDVSKTPAIMKAPLSDSSTTEIKADEYNIVRNYQLIDLLGSDYSKKLVDYRVTSFNSTEGQFNEESNKHKSEEYKKFFNSSIKKNILTNNSEDRLTFTPFIEKGLNTRTIYSTKLNDVARLADGRNRLLMHYLFSNLAITFATRGQTIRKPGRFFGLSKQNLNDKEFDHKIEGQYLITSVVHHFNPEKRNYFTQLVGIKTHTYKETTKFESSDVLIT